MVGAHTGAAYRSTEWTTLVRILLFPSLALPSLGRIRFNWVAKEDALRADLVRCAWKVSRVSVRTPRYSIAGLIVRFLQSKQKTGFQKAFLVVRRTASVFSTESFRPAPLIQALTVSRASLALA